MKRAAALLILGALLAGGWLTGKWLANNRALHGAAAPSMPRNARQMPSVGAKSDATAPQSRDFIAEWLRDQPFGPDMDSALEFFAQIIVRDDGESALEWASRISAPTRRAQVQRIVLEKWSFRDPAAAATAKHSLRADAPAAGGPPGGR